MMTSISNTNTPDDGSEFCYEIPAPSFGAYDSEAGVMTFSLGDLIPDENNMVTVMSNLDQSIKIILEHTASLSSCTKLTGDSHVYKFSNGISVKSDRALILKNI